MRQRHAYAYEELAEQTQGNDALPDNEQRSAAPLWSILSFLWLSDLLNLARTRSLQESDLPRIPYTSGELSDRFFNLQDQRYGFQPGIRNQELFTHIRLKMYRRTQKSQVKLTGVMNAQFGRHFWIACALEIAGDMCQLNAPFALGALLRFCTRSFRSTGPADDPWWLIGLFYALLLAGMQLVATVLREQAFWRAHCQGGKARAALSVCIYRIAQSMPSADRLANPISKLLNHLSTDMSR